MKKENEKKDSARVKKLDKKLGEKGAEKFEHGKVKKTVKKSK